VFDVLGCDVPPLGDGDTGGALAAFFVAENDVDLLEVVSNRSGLRDDPDSLSIWIDESDPRRTEVPDLDDDAACLFEERLRLAYAYDSVG